jgi:precorrin-3B C17-methyltransferase
VVRDALREGQSVRLTTLEYLKEDDLDMRTVVIVGNTATMVRDGRMVTTRGYSVKDAELSSGRQEA